MKRFLAMAMSLVIGATSIWTTGLTTYAAEDADTDEAVAAEAGEQEDTYDNIFGDDPVNKKDYYATFTVETNGEQFVQRIKINGAEKVSTASPLNAVSTLNATVSGNQVNSYKFYEKLMNDINTFMAKDKDAEIVGWTVYTDAHNTQEEDALTTEYNSRGATTYLNSDACTYGYGDSYWDDELYEWVEEKQYFSLYETRDYHFVAQVAKKAAENIYVSVIPGVNYDGRAHVAQGTELNKKDVKKTATDLRVAVYRKNSSYYSSSYYRLYAGSDYTLEYENNTNASVKLVREGEGAGSYEKTWTDNKSRPTVHVTGVNDYKGFSADIYFDILPVTLGAYEYRYDYVSMNPTDYYNNRYGSNYQTYAYTNSNAASVAGLAYTYTPSSVKKIKKIKVTKTTYCDGYFYNTKKKYTEHYNQSFTSTLKAGEDYDLEVYKWNPDTKVWSIQEGKAPKDCTEEGDYLCVVRGKGNYCGAVYGYTRQTDSADDNTFNAGRNGKDPNPYQSNATYMQFKVTKNASYDLTKAKTKIGKKKQKYVSDEKKYDAKSFKISVKAGGKTLKAGQDYSVSFSPVGGNNHMKNEYGVNSGNTIAAANEYYVNIYGIAPYYGSKYAGRVKITGVTLKANMFKYLKTVKHDKEQKIEISDKGKKKNLTFDDKTSPYYVPNVPAHMGPYTAKTSKKGTTYYYWMGGSYSEEICDAEGNTLYWQTNKVGNGIYPKQLKLKYLVAYERITIEQAISEKRLGIKLGESPAQFNYGGTYPDVTLTGYLDHPYEDEEYDPETDTWKKVTVDHHDIKYSGETEVYKNRVFEIYIKGYHYNGFLTVTAQNNTGLGNATLTFTGSGVLKGTKDEGFVIEERIVDDIDDAWYYDFTESDPSYSAGTVSAIIKDRKKGSGEDKFTAGDIKLYQNYYEYDAKEDRTYTRVVELPQTLYDVSENEPLGAKGIAWEVYAKDGSEQGLNFGYNSWNYETASYTFTPQRIYAGVFGLYDNAVALSDVDAVNLNVRKEDGSGETEGKDFSQSSGKLTYAPKFTGVSINPSINSIKLTGGTVLNNYDDIRSRVRYGYNRPAGTPATMKCRLKYDEYEDAYTHGGDLEFTFDILENATATL